MANGNREFELVCQLLKLDLPQAQRYPLLPPPSAVISRRLALAWRFLPIVDHHRRMALTANEAVSWSVPTLTHPTLALMSSTPYGTARRSFRSMKSWTLQ